MSDNNDNDNVVSISHARNKKDEETTSNEYQDESFVEYSAVFTYRDGDDFPECNFLMDRGLLDRDGDNLSYRIHADLLSAINIIRSTNELPMIDPMEVGEPDYFPDDDD